MRGKLDDMVVTVHQAIIRRVPLLLIGRKKRDALFLSMTVL
jgi:hypothetical protein